MLVAQGGKVLYRKAFGLANLEERTPITTATNFRLASVTKQFTATAVLLLAERGELSLDDPLTRFFPGFARAAHGVKVRHLLGHTSGLLDYEELIPPGTTVPLKDKDVLDLVGRQDRLYFAPGSQFRYSNKAGVRTLTQRAPWAVAADFGLLHGLGFAGALAEVGLPTAEIPLALFSFNLGIELGQLAFVSAVLLLAAGLRKVPVAWPHWAKASVAYGIGTMAIYWFLQRAVALM